MLHINLVGLEAARIAASTAPNETLCYRRSYAIVARAASRTGLLTMPRWSNADSFCRLWGGIMGAGWTDLPERHRGHGAPGALSHKGFGRQVDQEGIWAGHLSPGAVIQTWTTAAGLERVREGSPPGEYGHSFVFLRYVWEGAALGGMKVADNGYHGARTVLRSNWGFWIGCNLTLARDIPEYADPGRSILA